jgi:sugar phosphate isomerase/epimerase
MKLAYPVATPEVKAKILGCTLPIAQACAELRAAGYAGIEPFVCNPMRFDVEAWLDEVKRHDLAIAAVGTGPMVFDDGLSFTAADPARRRIAIDRAKAVVTFAARCRAQLNIGKLRGDLRGDPAGKADEWMREAFLEVCAYAAASGVSVTLEPQNRTVVDNLNTTAEAIAWIDAQRISNLGLLLDSFHMDHETEDLASSLTQARTHLWHVHFADTQRGVPGTGRIDFAAIVLRLRELGYDRFITVEAKPEPDSLTAARRAADLLLPLLSSSCASA